MVLKLFVWALFNIHVGKQVIDQRDEQGLILVYNQMNFNTIEGLVSAFQNGMTLENPLKIERFIAKRLRSGIFAQILTKTSGGYLGH